MKRLILCIIVMVTGYSMSAQYDYPYSKTEAVSDTYFGTTVVDHYRWMEDPNDLKVKNWFKTQADFTNDELAKIPNQDKLIQEFKRYDAMRNSNYSPIAKRNGIYFYKKRLPEDQVAKLYCRRGEKGKEILLFDPQKHVDGKTFIYQPSISDDGSKIVMNLSETGKELGDIRIIDVATNKFLPDLIPHSSDGEFVSGSNTTFFYIQYKGYDVHDPENNLNTPCKLHTIGAPHDSDRVIASAKKNPELRILPGDYPFVSTFNHSDYMILGKYTVENNLTLYFAPKSALSSVKVEWKSLTTTDDEIRQFFVHGNDIYFLSTKDNPRFKIIKTSFKDPDLEKAIPIVEGDDEWQVSADYISETKDYLIFNKTKNELEAEIYQYAFGTGKTTKINVPLAGNILALNLSLDENEIVLANLGWTIPYNFYKYNAATQELSDGIFNNTMDYPNLENLVYEEIEVPSWDGVLVPLSIVYDKTKLKKDGSNIAFMQGYGAYGVNYLPFFDPLTLPLLNRGVVLAFAHVRGGGEKGNDWYLAGRKTTKPNTWKDFNACTEWLIENKYSSPGRFGISGGSAGGILIGRAITERPDLYKVAIPKVGCMNTLRLEFSPNGPVNIPEYGTVAIEEEFRALLEMDAFHHIEKGVNYPAQLITTGFNDPRVESYNPAKFAAKMQAATGSSDPVLLYVDFEAGHFGGSTVEENYLQLAKEYAFLLWQCGDEEFKAKR